MILDRIKNILKATINEKLEKLNDFSNEKFNVDFNWYREKNNFDETFYQDTYQDDSFYQKNIYQNDKEVVYYRDLELPLGASFQEIKKSYRKLIKMYHPDLFVQNSKKQEMARTVTARINEAYRYFEAKN